MVFYTSNIQSRRNSINIPDIRISHILYWGIILLYYDILSVCINRKANTIKHSEKYYNN